MGSNSKIEWTDATWNPIIGCSKVSSGCDNCYAERMAGRFCKTGGYYNGVVIPMTIPRKPMWTGKPEFKAHKLYEPLRWRKPRTVFVCSMGDLFHESVPAEWIDKVMAVIAMAEQHRFMILTKRPKRMLEYFEYSNLPAHIMTQLDMWHEHDPKHDDLAIEAAAKIGCYKNWPLDNLAIGVSVEDQQTADERIHSLLRTPASHYRFVSYEPALGLVDFTTFCYMLEQQSYDLNTLTGKVVTNGGYFAIPGIDLVIMGGESGPNARPMHLDWARSVRDQCSQAGVPFFFKQWGEWLPFDQRGDEMFANSTGQKRCDFAWKTGKIPAGRLLDGQEHTGTINWKI
ncbi:phage Gp37/Gp68 family protein [Prosthecochloris sp.]|uniref:phage Gp37/Gp68 family protein n=1 Tax=Prosthecochloris sp. TaxID=290513 RepID=UPI0025D50F44|nr:phage Gp37/Gp68 family protein [Prosthecochloris sp.]